jgi:hypothetical protein
MARRATRRGYDRPVEVKEPVKSGFTPGNLLNLGAIPLLTAMLTGIGFYFSTNAKLERYADEIKTINQRIEQTGKVVESKTVEDTAQREKIRDAFLAAQTKTNEGIGKLDTRLAVAEKQQETANAALAKISESLNKISSFSRR